MSCGESGCLIGIKGRAKSSALLANIARSKAEYSLSDLSVRVQTLVERGINSTRTCATGAIAAGSILAVCALGSRLDQTQKAMMVARATADRKFAASLS